MATIGPITVHLETDTRPARFVIKLLTPFVLAGVLSLDRAAKIAARFVRVRATLEGWGGGRG